MIRKRESALKLSQTMKHYKNLLYLKLYLSVTIELQDACITKVYNTHKPSILINLKIKNIKFKHKNKKKNKKKQENRTENTTTFAPSSDIFKYSIYLHYVHKHFKFWAILS